MQYSSDSTDAHRPRNAASADGGSHDPEQGDLFAQVDEPEQLGTVTPLHDESLTTSERFEAFHALNPHVYDALVSLARRFIAATGKRKLGAQRLVEIARWDMELATKGEEEFEINNTYRAYYARLIMWQEPDLHDVFDLRHAPEPDAWIADLKLAAVSGAA